MRYAARRTSSASAIGQGFCQMDAADFVGAVEIGQRAGDAQHAMIAARGDPHGIGDVAQQSKAAGVRPGHVFELSA
jgi:hypothetical protein